MKDFEGKVAVVTGAASGIGLGMATRFAQEGMKVVLADVEQPALDAAVLQLQRAEHQVIGVHADVSDGKSVDALAKAALDAYGAVDVLCNNAGVGGGRGLLWESTMKDWQWVFGVNFWGVLHGIRTFVPIMLSQGEEGHIVNTASLAGLAPGSGIYAVTKHAVVSLTEALNANLRMIQSKIGVSCLCPGFVKTNILNAERNRPTEWSNEGAEAPLNPAEEMFRKYMEDSVAAGMAPEQVGDIVLQGIRDDRFWILTSEQFDTVVQMRMESILSRTNPAPPRLP
jgi:NAD(P)-dependent dehydrogenase (short-subunit alcohol dehydrogenase family)